MKAIKIISYFLLGASFVAVFFVVQFLLVMAHAWIAQLGFSLFSNN